MNSINLSNADITLNITLNKKKYITYLLLPSTHIKHSAWPTASVYVPFTQDWGSADPMGQWNPIGHISCVIKLDPNGQ